MGNIDYSIETLLKKGGKVTGCMGFPWDPKVHTHLCKPIGGRCPDCIHGQGVCTVASPCAFDETYENIIDAQSIEDLYDAIQDRADYLELLIKN